MAERFILELRASKGLSSFNFKLRTSREDLFDFFHFLGSDDDPNHWGDWMSKFSSIIDHDIAHHNMIIFINYVSILGRYIEWKQSSLLNGDADYLRREQSPRNVLELTCGCISQLFSLFGDLFWVAPKISHIQKGSSR
jgi:hypothetical protein